MCGSSGFVCHRVSLALCLPDRTVALTGASFTCWAELLQSDLIAVFAGGWPQPRAATDVGLTSVAAFGFEAYYFLALGCH